MQTTTDVLIPEPPVHPLSSLVTIVLDILWFFMEAPLTFSVVGVTALLPLMVFLFVICTLVVSCIQHFVANDNWGASFSKGMAMGVLAAVPYAVVGSGAGIVLLAWGGIHKFETSIRKSLPSG